MRHTPPTAAAAADDPHAPRESLTIRPPAGTWPALVRHNQGAEATQFRRELGLPVGRPLIMTGHQAEFWHPGILAKYLAADAMAGVVGADVAWLVVDQDRPETVAVRYPGRLSDGRLGATVEVIGSAAARDLERIGVESGQGTTWPFVVAGLKNIVTSLGRRAQEPILVRRIAASLSDLVSPLLRSRPAPTTIFATGLSRATLFGQLVDRMRSEPERCVAAYNAAVAHHVSAGVRPLLADDIQDRFELPLWWLPPGRPRQHVYAEMLGQIPPYELAPKALLMTGLMRLAGCDLFIHGTGGGGDDGDAGHDGYDLVTEEWLSSWLGIGPGSLAPITVVSATRFLPLGAPAPPSPDAVARAVWMAHSAGHSPYLLRDSYFDDAKRRLVVQIAAAPQKDRSRLFREIHGVLGEYRRAHQADLRGLKERSDSLVASAQNGAVLYDRAWPFPLYPDSVLGGLRDDIVAAFSRA